MKTITKISTQKQAGRYSIELDKKFAFGVAESVLIKYGLAKGRELDEKLIEQIKHDDEVAKGLNVALNYLGHTLRTKKQIKQKLHEKSVNDNVQEQIMDKLQSLGYVDDNNYAIRYVATKKLITPKGPQVIRLALKQAGVSDEIIDSALANYTDDEQLEIASKIAEKASRNYKRESIQLKKQKVMQYVVSKGFSFAIAQVVSDNIEFNNSVSEQENLNRQLYKLWQKHQTETPEQRRYKVKRQLYVKGFNSELIDNAIADYDTDFF
ncbi:recombination regulator RecX [Leuconostoc palmae]|uniref:recombination regulator RecX n=1 Tax=Leuconostoc palmae TaxID=501487 RepID=UPI001C7CD1C8|nr:recombination regulator RecX [Leuconostoc palmae]